MTNAITALDPMAATAVPDREDPGRDHGPEADGEGDLEIQGSGVLDHSLEQRLFQFACNCVASTNEP
ncbi:hypothetical protein ACFQL1_05800 [Halomicroarcula sp. GCM10025709]|uniref:hypothetical protein n=1 Tax=Halomicroarcula sp. GCM10025709 TaxID=3252669 RepID=UPI00361FC97B